LNATRPDRYRICLSPPATASGRNDVVADTVLEPHFMNYPAAIIAAGLGTAFFAAELAFYFQPSWINSDYIMGVVFSSSHSKARVAVQRLLVDPPSAEFGEL
jgi:hypothetical protein